MPQEGYKAVSMKKELHERIKAVNIIYEPRLNRNAFMEEVVEFYIDNHCPICAACITKKVKHHKC